MNRWPRRYLHRHFGRIFLHFEAHLKIGNFLWQNLRLCIREGSIFKIPLPHLPPPSPPPSLSRYEDHEKELQPVAASRCSVSRNSGKFKGNPQSIVSVPNTRPSERNTTQSTNRMNIRDFWGHDTAELAGSILKVLPLLKTKTENTTEMFVPILRNI